MIEKRCCSCKTMKPVAEFYRDRGIADGFSSQCKRCNYACRKARKARARAGELPVTFKACKTREQRRAWLEQKYIPEPNTGCWLWLFRMDKMGYGVAFFRKRSGTLAHRAVYEELVGPIPKGMYLCHKCDTPLCVNPAHMFIGDDSSNLRDCVKKERCGSAKITNAKAVEMRRLYRTGGFTQKELGEMFGLGRTAARNVTRGHTWKDAEEVVGVLSSEGSGSGEKK